MSQPNTANAPLARLVDALRAPSRYPHRVYRVEVIETHISYVLLAGEFAYKLKKPLDLGFLDFSTLAARKRCCEDELRLNRRTAPDLYLDVVAIGGTPESPVLDGGAAPIEYAVKMRRFSQEALLDRVAKRGELTVAHADALAEALADFHSRVDRAGRESEQGTPARVVEPAEQNFAQIEALTDAPADIEKLEQLRTWTEHEYGAALETLSRRHREGFVRECHGDLHLGNIALIEGRPVAFDCIEFNADLRWIDVMSEVAFLLMDLLDHRLAPLAWRFLDRYLALTGDYEGVRVLRFYLVYRAMVRAKIACIRAHQTGVSATAQGRLAAEYRGYLDLARSIAVAACPAVILMHGVSGSGKTTVAQHLLETLGAVRVRSDVERKRLFGLGALARTREPVDAGIYSADATRRTYERLADLARAIVRGGLPAIVDAAFLRRDERDALRAVAVERDAPFVIATCRAAEATLRERVRVRELAARDPSEATVAVLEHQLATQEPLGADELADAVVFDTERGPEAIERASAEVARKVCISA